MKDVALAVACELGGYGGEGIPYDHISIVIKPCQSYHAFLSSRRTCMYSFSSLIPENGAGIGDDPSQTIGGKYDIVQKMKYSEPEEPWSRAQASSFSRDIKHCAQFDMQTTFDKTPNPESLLLGFKIASGCGSKMPPCQS